MKIVIIGTGNVATVFGRKILEAGHKILQVVGRNHKRASELASLLNSTALTNLLDISLDGDLYIIATSDTSVELIAQDLKLNNKVVVHTAASVSINILKEVSVNHGVIYPLQSLNKDVTVIPAIPVLINASNEMTKNTLKEFSSTWTDYVSFATDDERLKLHVAAVVVNNFSNHLFTLTQDYCNNEGLKFNVLEPLIKETIERIKGKSPASVQTGPAIRNDLVTIKKHRELLNDHPLLNDVYNTMSESIITYYFNNSK